MLFVVLCVLVVVVSVCRYCSLFVVCSLLCGVFCSMFVFRRALLVLLFVACVVVAWLLCVACCLMIVDG